jgi:Ca2+-binding RTX toxin-like protein
MARTTFLRPHAERLESRDCPSVSVLQREHVLYLTGDRADDRVAVRDLGGVGYEVVTERGPATFRGVEIIAAKLGDGHDTFHFRQAPRPSERLDVVLDLGAGHDTVRYAEPSETSSPDPYRRAVHTLDIRGGLGSDDVEIVPCIMPGWDLDIQSAMGPGNDTFSMVAKKIEGASELEIVPCVDVEVDGGEGSDLIQVGVGDPHAPLAGRLEDLTIDLHGGRDGDVASVDLENLAVSGPLAVGIDLGGGPDGLLLKSGQMRVGGPVRYDLHLGDGSDYALVEFGDHGRRPVPASPVVSGGAGDDTLASRLTDAAILSNGIFITLFGGPGDDLVTGDNGPNVLYGGPGLDLILGLGGGDDIYGGADDDVIEGGVGYDAIRGESGNDTIDAGAGHDEVWGGIGDDLIHGRAEPDMIDGGPGDDILYGNSGDDIILGGAGTFDRLEGNEGNDILDGGLGDDWLIGGDDDDILLGKTGDDRLEGGDGDDHLDAGPDGNGADELSGGDGDDFLICSFLDFFHGGAGTDTLIIDGEIVMD